MLLLLLTCLNFKILEFEFYNFKNYVLPLQIPGLRLVFNTACTKTILSVSFTEKCIIYGNFFKGTHLICLNILHKRTDLFLLQKYIHPKHHNVDVLQTK